MRPVVFLDIDGVLSTDEEYVLFRQGGLSPFDPSHLERHHELIRPSCVEVLNDITGSVGAEVVVSSSWRNLYEHDGWPGFDGLVQVLRQAGVRAPIVGRTPRLRYGRGSEVEAWLSSAGHDGPFAVLDDAHDMEGWPELVLVNPETGLVQDDVFRAFSALRAIDRR